MSPPASIQIIPSSLHQAGIEAIEFSSQTLKIHELTGISLARMHSRLDAGDLVPGYKNLPHEPGQSKGSDPAMLCLRPREWLFISASEEAAELLQQVKSFADPGSTVVYDHSDGLAVFRLSGRGAPWLLSKVSGLDYLAGQDSGEHCTRTKMGHVAVVVHFHPVPEDTFVFDLIIDRSLAKYLWDLLSASAPHTDELVLNCGTVA